MKQMIASKAKVQLQLTVKTKFNLKNFNIIYFTVNKSQDYYYQYQWTLISPLSVIEIVV